jgi:4-amino-4-deoxy-L-arabinose transferase-like glycosyltransferase
MLFASIPWTLFLAAVTEALSPAHLVTKTGLTVAWLGFAVVCLFWTSRPKVPNSFRQPRLRDWGKALTPAEKLLLAGAPNTWDAMEYHLPRVTEWAANRGVQLYPTIDRQQLTMPPLAEYIMLHLDLLYGTDRLVNLVQWFSWLGFVLGASLIAKSLNGDRRAQILAAVLAATIPVGILGASGAKNDCVLAYWITLTVYLLLGWKDRKTFYQMFGIAAAVSLSVFTKGTAYVFLPCLFLACFLSWDRASFRRFLVLAPVIAAFVVALNAPLWARNLEMSGSIFGLPYFEGAGPTSSRMIANSHIAPAPALANTIRNIGLNLGVPDDKVNRGTGRFLSRCIRALGVDPDDPGQIVIGQSGVFRPFSIDWGPRTEVRAGNPIHLILFLAAGLIWLFWFRSSCGRSGLLALGSLGAFCLYSAMIRWSPFNARYQLPVFVLGSAFTALVLAGLKPRKTVTFLLFIPLLIALRAAASNDSRPLLTRAGSGESILRMSRDETYFLDAHRAIAGSFIAAAKAATDEPCGSIGVDANLLHFEYPMFALLTQDGVERRLSYLAVGNPTAAYPVWSGESPCLAICLGCGRSTSKMGEYAATWGQARTFGDVVVFSDRKSVPAR